jgi:hypothetical protein
VDVPDAGDRLEDILGQALRLPALDGSRKGYLAILDLDLDTGGVEHAVMRQMLADIFLDSGIASLITLWTAATVRTGHPASGSRVACAAAFRSLAMTAVALSTPACGLLLPPGAASTNALTATGALSPVAARSLVPVASFVAVALRRAHGTWFRTALFGAVRTLPTTELPFAAIFPLSWWALLPAPFTLERLIVVILTVLPADALASVVLAVALIGVLSDALITELSLGAIAVAGILALALATGPATVLTTVHRSLPAEPGLTATLAAELVSVTFIPIHIPMLMMAMFAMSHLKRPPSRCSRRAMHGSRDTHVSALWVARAVPWRSPREVKKGSSFGLLTAPIEPWAGYRNRR